MLKIRLYQHWEHRNETTFRPYLSAASLFRDIGIQFVFDGPHDLTWIGQATYANKAIPMETMLKVNHSWTMKDVTGDYIFFDGQDSPSVTGAWEAFCEWDAKILLKNSLYVDKSWYDVPTVHGRYWWGNAESHDQPSHYNYVPKGLDLSKIKLSGTNWLSTVNPFWYRLEDVPKDIDVFAMFSCPSKPNFEYNLLINQFYDAHRTPCIETIKQLPPQVSVARLINGKKVPVEQYYQNMLRSKIIVAPFGYGEIAPRDLESAMVHAVLIKPDMNHVETIPNPYVANETYRPCKWDFSDLNDIIIDTLDNYEYYRDKFVTNLRETYLKLYKPEFVVEYMHGIISSIDGYGTI